MLLITKNNGLQTDLSVPGNFTANSFGVVADGNGTAVVANNTVSISEGWLTINLNFEGSTKSAPASFIQGVEAAATILASTISEKITFNVNIAYSGTGGGADGGPDNGQDISYSTLRADLINNATPAEASIFKSLPAGSSIQGENQIYVSNAELKAFGIINPNNASTDDGTETFSTDIPTNDLVGVALHEITHAMGRSPDNSIFDLFRFTSPGVRLFSGNIPSSAAYFSVNGGATALADYGMTSDPSDFLNTGIQGSRDAFNEIYNANTSQKLSAIDLEQLNVLGFNTDTTQPSISSVSYNAASGLLILTGANLTSTAASFKVTDFKLNGDGNTAYTLSNASKIAGRPDSSSFSIQLSTADQLAVNGLLNKNGNTAVSGATYNLSASAGWDTGSLIINTQAINVSNATTPALTEVTYNAASGVFGFTGGSLVNHGGGSGITLADFALKVGSVSYTFTSSDKLSAFSSRGFSVTLTSTHKAAISTLINNNGSFAVSGAAYNLTASTGWDTDSAAASNTLSLTTRGKTSNVQTLLTTGLSNPIGITVDSSGNVYVIDQNHDAIKEIAADSHSVTTLLSGLGSPGGLAIDSIGNLYFSNATTDSIEKISATTHATTSVLNTGNTDAFSIALDSSGDIYLADHTANKILEYAAGNLAVTTILSSGIKSLAGIAVDAAGDVFFADSGSNTIKEMSAGSHTATSILAKGLNKPQGIALDSFGNLYITDTGNNAVKEIAAGSHLVTTLDTAGLNAPKGIAIDSTGNVYVTNTGNNKVLELTHADYLLNTPLAMQTPVTISTLWENTQQIELSKSVYTAFSGETTLSAANFSSITSTSGHTNLFYDSKTGGLYYEAPAAATATEIGIVGVSSHPASLTPGDFRLVG